MRIDGAGNFIPPHIARAYGVAAKRPALPAQAHPAAPIASIGPTAGPSSAGLNALVAGRVPGNVQFDGVSVPRLDMTVLHMYTRAADKIEAATAVHIGRAIDIKG